jgi:hypothetical protein
MRLAKKCFGGIRIAKVLSETHSLRVSLDVRSSKLQTMTSQRLSIPKWPSCFRVIDRIESVRKFNGERLPLFVVKYSSEQLTRLLCEPLGRLLKLAFVLPRDFPRGFFDAEGFVEVAAKDVFGVCVGAENSNRALLSGTRRILRSTFHIGSTMRRKRKSNSPKTIRGESFLTRRTSYRLLIARVDDIERFRSLVGFSICRKMEKLEDAERVLEIEGPRRRSAARRETYLKQNGEWVKRQCA